MCFGDGRGTDQLLTAFISHYEHGGRRSGPFWIEHLQWHQVLGVRLQIMDLMTLRSRRKEEREEMDGEWDEKIENKFLIRIEAQKLQSKYLFIQSESTARRRSWIVVQSPGTFGVTKRLRGQRCRRRRHRRCCQRNDNDDDK